MAEIEPPSYNQEDANPAVEEKVATEIALDEKKHLNHDTAGYAIVEQGNTIPTTGERKVTTRREYWSYCLYGWGGTGVGVGNYGSSLQQNLVEQAFPSGYMRWGGTNTSVDSFILDLSGILFAVQLVVLLIIGPYADYGTWRPWILIAWTVIGIASSFAFFGLTHADQWALASGFYVVSNLALNITGSFYQAPFPMLVRDMPKLIESERQVIEGTKSPEDHAMLDMLERSKLSNISLMFSAIGSMLCILISLGICYGIGTATVAENTKVYSVIIGFFGVIWVISSIPWFWWEQRRPGQRLPDNTNWLTVGPKQVWEAAKNAAKLKQTFLYLTGYFLIADVYNTSGSIVNILQNDAIDFDSITYCGLFALVYGLEFVCIMINQYIQAKFKISPKWMFFAAACGIEFTNLWGLIGIWTDKIGYHHVWEFWFYQACIGVLTSGWFSYGQTLMAEVSPAPKMYIFFALYNTLGKTAAFIGPFITGAIIDDTGNTNTGFYFTFFTGLIALVLLAMVDTDKAKRDNAAYLEKEREDLYASYQVNDIFHQTTGVEEATV